MDLTNNLTCVLSFVYFVTCKIFYFYTTYKFDIKCTLHIVKFTYFHLVTLPNSNIIQNVCAIFIYSAFVLYIMYTDLIFINASLTILMRNLPIS